ncbi:unnamed protein product, partial [Hapterophycus canaliculatus]
DGALQPLQVVHSWAFEPSLRRMCTAICLAAKGSDAGGQAAGAGGGGGGQSAAAADGREATPPFHDRLWIVAKGAPESLEPLLTDAPPHYRSTFLHHMGKGSRVLALAYRALEPGEDAAACRRMSRSSAERGLRFGGFLVLGCPLKPDAPYVVRELRESSHAVCMITGDGALTAADVARQVGMIDHPPARTLVLSGAGTAAAAAAAAARSGGGDEEAAEAVEGSPASEAGGSPGASLRWISLTAGFSGGAGAGAGGGGSGGVIPFDAESIAVLAERHTLCVTGDVLSQVSAVATAFPGGRGTGAPPQREPADTGTSSGGGERSPAPSGAPSSALSCLCSHATVFARVSPAQKELIIGELNASGRTTVMCGDGTNDVGALRRAHVGISIVNSPELERRLDAYLGNGEPQQPTAQEGGPRSGNGGGGGSGSGRRGKRSQAKQSRMLALREIEEQQNDPALVKLGDASIASPFTAKTTSVGCVLAVIRQGRCTLVTTLQVYKILALNCLTSAYMLSALYLKGVKQGDGQMTVLGLAISALFYCASRSHPLRRLSAARPPARIFCLQACCSVLGQFAAHLASLVVVTRLCEEHINPEDPSVMPDGPFRPNTFNSAVFLLSAVMQV